jgi:Asp-tRNA(Asn)/Glu-tRNA(Gln) amidotransferase A subunit family amidase
MSVNLADTIAAASRLIEARELSPLELADGLLQRIESIDPVLNSFITVTAEAAVSKVYANHIPRTNAGVVDKAMMGIAALDSSYAADQLQHAAS